MKPGPVIAGLDGSLEAARAAALAWRLARAGGRDFHLIHAVRDVTNDLLLTATPAGVAELRANLHRTAHDGLTTVQRRAMPPEALARLEIRSGRAAVVLDQATREYDGAFVVLGGKRHGTLDRWTGGSTAHAAVRRLPVPVLITMGAAPPPRRILVAVDLSPAAAQAIDAARAVAALTGAEVRVLHVIEPVPLVVAGVPSQPDPEHLTPAAVHQLQQEIGPLVGAEDVALRCGPPGREIELEAAAWHADLVVVGSHGRGWFSRLIVGSVTETLLADLPTSLLVVPLPAPDLAQHAHAVVAGSRVWHPTDTEAGDG